MDLRGRIFEIISKVINEKDSYSDWIKHTKLTPFRQLKMSPSARAK